MNKFVFKLLVIFLCHTAIAQNRIFIPDLSEVKDATKRVILSRDISYDIKGENLQGQNFVRIAFHVIDNKRYDAIYFRLSE
jgi:hypothetical protein